MIKSISVEEKSITKNDIIELLKIYGLDKKKIEAVIQRARLEQIFEVQTSYGTVKLKLDFGVRGFYIEAPLLVQEMFAKLKK